jgi:hypothetical protein
MFKKISVIFITGIFIFGIIDLRKSNGTILLNVVSWFHETTWNPGAA